MAMLTCSEKEVREEHGCDDSPTRNVQHIVELDLKIRRHKQ